MRGKKPCTSMSKLSLGPQAVRRRSGMCPSPANMDTSDPKTIVFSTGDIVGTSEPPRSPDPQAPARNSRGSRGHDISPTPPIIMIIIDRWRCVVSIIIIIIGGRGCELVRYRGRDSPAVPGWGLGKSLFFGKILSKSWKCSQIPQNGPQKKHDFSNVRRIQLLQTRVGKIAESLQTWAWSACLQRLSDFFC